MPVSFKFLERASAKTIPIIPIETAVLKAWRKTQSEDHAGLDRERRLQGQAGRDQPGRGSRRQARLQILFGVDAHDGFWAYAGLPSSLPAGSYRIDARFERDSGDVRSPRAGRSAAIALTATRRRRPTTAPTLGLAGRLPTADKSFVRRGRRAWSAI